MSGPGQRSHTTSFLSLMLIAFSLYAGAAHAAGADKPFAASYYDALLAGTKSAQKELPTMAKAGEIVAQRVIAGGDLYIASVRFDFVSEGMGRSGGLMLLREYSPNVELSKKDAVIFSWSNSDPAQDLALAQKLQSTGAYVIGIGPKPADANGDQLLNSLSVFLESSAPLPPDVLRRFKGQAYPIVSQQNLTLLWAFTGEVVSALTRRGQMPVMYQSVLVPGARERNLALRGQKLHKENVVPAIPAGQLGQAYLNILGDLFAAVGKDETAAIEKVAQACVDTLRDGHQVDAWLISHYPHHQPGAPGDPQTIRSFARISGEVPQIPEVRTMLKPGDLFLFIGYYRRPSEVYEVAKGIGAKIVEVISGMGKPETAPPQPDYVIQPKWPFGDALVTVPNYDVKILPSSGVMQASIWWAIVGSVVAEEEKIADTIRSMKFAQVRPGIFQMGSDSGDADQQPAHQVTLTRPFEMQTTQVTQAQWEAVMGSNPSEFKGSDRPVDNVTWNDAQDFISKLNARSDGSVYRLPTEAEWEFACRAGTKNESAGNLDDSAWYLKNSGRQTHPVAQKQPNAWGLSDMNGNVWEWVQDYHAKYSAVPSTDPQGPASGSSRGARGCGWGGAASICTCTFRESLAPIRRDGALGFRLARTREK